MFIAKQTLFGHVSGYTIEQRLFHILHDPQTMLQPKLIDVLVRDRAKIHVGVPQQVFNVEIVYVYD